MAQNRRKYDEAVKIMLLGESGVGKSSLLVRFTEDKFFSSNATTLGVEYKQRIEKIEGRRVSIQVWDTAGQEKFRTITPIYYRNVEGVFIVFDICNMNSFESVSFWMDNLNENVDIKTLKMMLIGNKTDLADKRVVTKEQGEELAKKYGIRYTEASAKNKANLSEMFVELTKDILQSKSESHQASPEGPERIILDPNSATQDTSAKAKGGCCK